MMDMMFDMIIKQKGSVDAGDVAIPLNPREPSEPVRPFPSAPQPF